jgi:Uma2 family endonuclease
VSVTAVRSPSLPAPPDKGVGPRRWTRRKYQLAAEIGLFRPDERLELLDGEIIQKMAPGGPHAAVVSRADRMLANAFGPGHHTRVQQPLILSDWSEPEPDVVVVPGTEFDFLPDHPRAADTRLVVEVSDTTLRLDRGRKKIASARSGVREYWIINLLHRQVEVFRDPSGSRCRSATVYGEPDAITPLAAPGVSIRVSDLLPPPAIPGND